MKLIVVVLLFVLASICDSSEHFWGCRPDKINKIRKKYINDIYDEIEDLKEINSTRKVYSKRIEIKLSALRRDIENARPNNDDTVNNCLNELASKADYISEIYPINLGICYAQIKSSVNRVHTAAKVAKAKINECAHQKHSFCKKIEECCERVAENFDDDDYDDKVEIIVDRYQYCIEKKFKIISRDISRIERNIQHCTALQDTTQAPVVTDEPSESSIVTHESTETPVVTDGSSRPTAATDEPTEGPVVTTDITDEPSQPSIEPTDAPEATDEPSASSVVTDEQTEGPDVTDGPSQPSNEPTDSDVTDGSTQPPVQTDGTTEAPVVTPEVTDGPSQPTDAPDVTDGSTQPPVQTDGPTQAPVVTPDVTDAPSQTSNEPTDTPDVTNGSTQPPVQTDEPTEAPVVTPDVTDGPSQPPIVTNETTDAPDVTNRPTDVPVATPDFTDGPSQPPVVTNEPTDSPSNVTDGSVATPGLNK